MTVPPTLRPATDDDWRAMFGCTAPVPGVWSGIVAANDYVVFGLGGIYAAADGRWWITFHRWPGVGYTKTAHKAAKEILGAARDANIEVHALADPEIPGSALWIERLGLKPTDERLGGMTVWVQKY